MGYKVKALSFYLIRLISGEPSLLSLLESVMRVLLISAPSELFVWKAPDCCSPDMGELLVL